MKIEVLREFLCLCEELSYTKAAQKLFINQSALSRHMASLESELGCALFDRDHHSVDLTGAGALLRNRAARLVSLYDGIVSEVRAESLRHGDAIRVGYLRGAASDILPAGKKLFRRRYSDVSVTVKSLHPDEMRGALNGDELDLIVSIFPKDRVPHTYDSRLVFADEFSLMVHPSNPIARRASVPAGEIPRPVRVPEGFPYEKELAENLLAMLSEANIPFMASEPIDEAGSIPMAFDDKRWIFVLCDHLRAMFKDRFSFVRIEGVDLGFDVRAAWKKSHSNPALAFFAECLCDAREIQAQALKG